MMYYSAANYWTPGWIYPRGKLREPFPRHRRVLLAALIPIVPRINGPLIFPAAGVYRPGMHSGSAYRPGATTSAIYRPGMQAGDVSG